ncbi:MAG TPA: hypothetical protein VMD48_09045 [Solirubrobacteraceae bacterium]|nr:hypothetical protein [Solirubrobacteraceae bacterium]
MLFDLRSRGRRRFVRVIYLGLALVMGGGLILFGVGAGNGFGGILNAFSGSGNGGAAKQQVSAQQKQANAAVKLNPRSASAWLSLVEADYEAAGQGSNYNTTSNTYTAGGKTQLQAAMTAWQRYLTLTKKPDANLAVLAARAYDALAQYKNETAAWQIVTNANPTVFTYYEDLALAAYQANNLTLGDLAAGKAVSLAPKAERLEVKNQLAQIRKEVAPTSASTTTSATTTTSSSSSSKKTKKK